MPTRNPTPETRNPKPETRNSKSPISKPQSSNTKHQTRNPKTPTCNPPTPQPPNPAPSTLILEPSTPNPSGRSGVCLMSIDEDGVVVICTLRPIFGSYLRLIASCIAHLKAQGPSRTCYEGKEERENRKPEPSPRQRERAVERLR